MCRVVTALLLMLISSPAMQSQSLPPTGSINGKVVDAGTKSPLIGATVLLVGTGIGIVTDAEGSFTLQKVPVGGYSVRFEFIGYSTATKTDVIVRSERATVVDAELQESSLQANEVVVSAGYFDQRVDQPTSMTSFSYEEIRRGPGSAGDISRIILGLPSLAKVNDQSNSLIVRGGSPIENAFLVDGIEVPNINHFPTQGATGGPIGIINVDLIKDASFSAGGFPATYGDRLSSVMELTLREGNKNRRDTQFDLNFAGVGGTTEGPIGEMGSYLLSVRRSYLDALVKVIDVGTSVAPSYGDVFAKIVENLSPEQTLSIIDLFSDDHNSPDHKTAVENKMQFYGSQDIYLNTIGATWKALWGGNAYSTAVVSYTTSLYNEQWSATNSGESLVRNNSNEGVARVSLLFHDKLSDFHSIQIGAEAKRFDSRYDNAYAAFTDATGNTTAPLALGTNLWTWYAAGFANYTLHAFQNLTATAGLRIEHYPYLSRTEYSPRVSASYQIDDLTALKASSGIYWQQLPLLLLSQHDANRQLRVPRAVHYILGVDRMMTDETKLTVEAYDKEYRNFPVDPSQPSLFLLDELFYRYGFFFSHEPLDDHGRARSRGIEVTIQKKLVENAYGLASASYFTTQYKADDNVWRNRVFDNRLIFSIEGGYKLNNEWEFSARWIYAGGVPYTPFDVSLSSRLDREVLDATRINDARLPAYHALNLRADKRFNFTSSSLVAYISIWNAYNRKNAATYFWNGAEDRQDVVYQWGILPIFGVEYQL
ncbi:MAG TPA: carboxypeptidase-like regulatory domain-containing protein [Bacteroidota bacterium]|nr:carboxypeptidase-like regulatory domain-containing protein [Bacteroidota bacterium]